MKKILLLLLILSGQIGFAQIPTPQKDTYINDFAHVLTADQVKSLNQNIFEIEKSSGVQLAVVLVDKIPKGYEIEDYALLIGRKWHVGKNENGIVYVASISQHKQRLEIARGLDSVFTNDKRSDILSQVTPYFKKQDYVGGIQTLINGIGSVAAPVAHGDSTTQAPNQAVAPAASSDGSNGDAIVGLIFVFLVIVFVVFIIRRSRRRRMNAMNWDQRNGYNNGGYGPGAGGSGVGSFVAGAAVGAAAVYAAGQIIDDINNQQQPDDGNYPDQNNNYQNDDNASGSDDDINKPSNWGNWGSGDSSDSGDSGFSAGDSSSDSGSSSDW